MDQPTCSSRHKMSIRYRQDTTEMLLCHPLYRHHGLVAATTYKGGVILPPRPSFPVVSRTTTKKKSQNASVCRKNRTKEPYRRVLLCNVGIADISADVQFPEHQTLLGLVSSTSKSNDRNPRESTLSETTGGFFVLFRRCKSAVLCCSRNHANNTAPATPGTDPGFGSPRFVRCFVPWAAHPLDGGIVTSFSFSTRQARRFAPQHSKMLLSTTSSPVMAW